MSVHEGFERPADVPRLRGGFSDEETFRQPFDFETISDGQSEGSLALAPQTSSEVHRAPVTYKAHTGRKLFAIVAATGIIGGGVIVGGAFAAIEGWKIFKHDAGALVHDAYRDTIAAGYRDTIGAGLHEAKSLLGDVGSGMKSAGHDAKSMLHDKNVPVKGGSEIVPGTEVEHPGIAISGGTITGFAAAYASHIHRFGGETYKKLVPFEVTIGDSAQQIKASTTVYADVQYKETFNKKGKLVSKTPVPGTSKPYEVKLILPTPSILSAEVPLNSDYMKAELVPGMDAQQIASAVQTYKNEIKAGKDPTNSGLSCHNSIWHGDIDCHAGDDSQDGDVTQVALSAVQTDVEIDSYNPSSPLFAQVTNETDKGLITYERGLLVPGEKLVIVQPKVQAEDQILAERAKALSSQALSVTSTMYFTYNPEFPVKGSDPSDPEYNLELYMGGDSNTYITLNDHETVGQIEALDQQDFPNQKMAPQSS